MQWLSGILSDVLNRIMFVIQHAALWEIIIIVVLILLGLLMLYYLILAVINR